MNPYIGLMIYGFILFRMIRLSNDACMLSVLTVNTMDLHSFNCPERSHRCNTVYHFDL